MLKTSDDRVLDYLSTRKASSCMAVRDQPASCLQPLRSLGGSWLRYFKWLSNTAADVFTMVVVVYLCNFGPFLAVVLDFFRNGTSQRAMVFNRPGVARAVLQSPP